jgi:farnesyl diphosphate synthase
MGIFFQVQDDFLDCFGDPATIGKIGTDIEDNKCSWLVVQALDKVSAEQKTLLEANYGQKDSEKVAKVKQLYRDIGLVELFQQFEEKSFADIDQKINNVDERVLSKQVFYSFAKKIYKRQK